MSAYDELAALVGLKNPIGHDLIVAASAEIVRLREGIDVARAGLLRIERQAEEARAAVTSSMRTINGLPDAALTAGERGT